MHLEPRPPLIKRLRSSHWLALDYLAAAVYALFALAMLAHDQSAAHLPLALAGTALVALPVALRRRHPLAAYGTLLTALLATPVAEGMGVLAMAPLAYVLYLVAVACRLRIALAALAASLAVLPSVMLPIHPSAVVPFALAFITAWTAGYAVGQHRRYGEELLRHRSRLAEAELDKAQRAVAEERMRIARELHDVVAHSMSVITVQAGFGHLVIDDKVAEARAALSAIETTGRETLAEMRRLLDVLRAEDPCHTAEIPALAPAPRFADLDRLLTQTAKAGVRVDLTVTGSPRDLPAGIDLSAYRIVQEALTNVVKHAGTTAARATVDYQESELTIEITDQGQGCQAADGHAFGHGLIGMQERVHLYGGWFRAAPLPERGFQVTARLPLTASAESAA
ncbi:sensor histidine kinase [Nonomuraea sp. NPDC050680]|uniref:sensor histidine kinase n=1 Tax=Nonomuraea sp. NPDC050680 TaxID=3154630 RepID=UPI0033C55449